MNDQETLTKKEFEFLTAIDKQNSLIEKLKIALEKAVENEKKTLETFKSEKDCLSNDCIALKAETESLKTELEEKITEAQTYIEEVETLNKTHLVLNEGLTKLNESHEKTIAELQKNVLPEAEILFWRGCKADVVLKKLAEQKKSQLSVDELKIAEFPLELLAKDSSGIVTSNYRLERVNENQYKLSRK